MMVVPESTVDIFVSYAREDLEFVRQLADELRHGQMLKERGIAYAPDFLINAGGIINVYAELEGYGKHEIMRKTENIFNTTLDIFAHSEKH